MDKIKFFSQQTLILLIKLYRYFISPWLGNCCRFYPSCSQYAMLAIERHGICRGILMAARRLLCCHPWHEGGYDPVPESKQTCVK
jgi:uncharacterized protein